MTKFEELCAAFKSSRDEYIAYRDACWDFAAHFLNGLISYLDLPGQTVSFIPLNDRDPTKNYTLPGAMQLDDDTFWHLGFGMTIYEAPGVFPQKIMMIPIRFKILGDNVTMILSDNDQEIRFPIADQTKPQEIYKMIFDSLRDFFIAGLDRFLNSSTTRGTIGFVMTTNE